MQLAGVDPLWIGAASAGGGLVSALVHMGVVCSAAEPRTPLTYKRTRLALSRQCVKSTYASAW